MIGVVLAMLAAPEKAPPPIITYTKPPPIVRTNTTPPTYRFGVWTMKDLGDYADAYTGNESGSTFGMLCGQDCIVYVDFRTRCDNGADYPGMINSPKGALSIKFRCHVVDGRYIYATKATGDYVDIFEGGGEIGFALPLQSGRFSVSRFSLNGSFQAAAAAITLIEKRQQQSQKGLRDFTI